MPLALWVWLAQMAAYHGFALLFEACERFGALAAFKVKTKERLSYRAMAPTVLRNQCLLLLPAMLLLEALGLAFVGERSLPLGVMLLGFAGLTVGHDVVQYAAHRFILHRPELMRRLGHALHHSTIGSRGISACYMSGPDYFLEIVCPYLIPLALIGGGGADAGFHVLVVAAGAFGGVYEHSGYDFGRGLRRRAGPGLAGRLRAVLGGMLSSEAHAAHHSRGNVSFSDGFGSSNLCDSLFRTRYDLVADRRRGAMQLAE